MRTVRLEISPTPAHVRTARLVAVAVARQCGVSESLLDEIRLAVGEACSRAVGLHRLHSPDELVRIEFSNGGRFGVSVRDAAPAELAMADAAPDPLALLNVTASGAAEEPVEGSAQQSPASSGAGPASSGPSATGAAGNEAFPEEALAAGVGLALLAGLVDDVEVTEAGEGHGSVVRMSWPLA
jgi:anti-sigma regulatory factor (Ser/Thr protein kinase)